jgi:CheY-like chemotaxis protein
MPEMDGWRTLENVRANPDFNAIRMVAITAYHSAQVALEARRVGFDAYFEKPIDVDTFMDTLGRIMG